MTPDDVRRLTEDVWPLAHVVEDMRRERDDDRPARRVAQGEVSAEAMITTDPQVSDPSLIQVRDREPGQV